MASSLLANFRFFLHKSSSPS